jgi:uncharacterized protein YaeQ
MAIGAQVVKATLHVSDLDRGYFGTHRLTLARESSETAERLVARLLAFSYEAGPDAELSAEMAETDEPAIARRDGAGEIVSWVEVGMPDPKRLKKAAARSRAVTLWLYHGRQAAAWWDSSRAGLEGLRALEVRELDSSAVRELATRAGKALEWSVTIQDGRALVADDDGAIGVDVEVRMARPESGPLARGPGGR